MKTLRGQLVVPLLSVLFTVCMVSASDGSSSGTSVPPGSGSPSAPCTIDTASFPSYPTIEPNIEFWTRVFGEWSLGQVVVHDLDYPGIIYDVVDLPGPIEERYTEEQQDFSEQLNEHWQDRLTALVGKISARSELDDAEKRLALDITTEAGSMAIEKADERVRTQRGVRERFRRGLEISHRYEPAIREILIEKGLPEDLAYLPHVESSYQAAARSSAGAVGVWQFTRSTGRRFMTINSAVDERLDPILASRGAADYLAEAHERLGDWALALTSYNHGLNGIVRATEQHGTDYESVFLQYRGRLFGFASKNFYSEFLAARDVACDPETYFPEGIRPEPEHHHEGVVTEGMTTGARIAGAYGIALDDLASINPAWSRRAVRSGLPLPSSSTVWLPNGTLDRLAASGIEPAAAWSRSLETDGTYVVQSGDTLSTIAQAYGLSLSRLRKLNSIPRGKSLIRVGQRVNITDETVASRTHVVRRGETLSGIASRYGMSLATLRDVNGMAPSQNLIRTGQRLRVAVGAAGIDPIVHVVRTGDTLIRIAVSYGVRLADLLLQNGLRLDSTIYPGQRIQIP
jgi:membrane-bound lytic murein transglycosylase D